MPKTNFTKVEEILEQGLRKYSVEHLLEVADEAGPKKTRNPSIAYDAEADQPVPPPLTRDQNLLIKSLQRDLKKFQKKDNAMYNLLGISKKDLKQMVDNPATLTPENWEMIKQIKLKIETYKADLLKQLPAQSNEDLIESERKEHVNRRYNVNKKWLPLT